MRLVGLSLCLGLALTACGDAPSPPGPSAKPNVAVTALGDRGGPLAGVPIIFLDSTGAPLETVITGADGRAVAAIDDNGASATLVVRAESSVLLRTVVGLRPGDDALLGGRGLPYRPAGDVMVDFAPMAGAERYDVRGPCGSREVREPPATLVLFADCIDGPRDVVVTALRGADRLGYVAARGLTLADGGVAMIPGEWTPLPTFGATVHGLDGTGVDRVSVVRHSSASTIDGMWTEVSEDSHTLGKDITPTSSAVVVTELSRGGARQAVVAQIAGDQLDYRLNARLALLPWIGYPEVDLAANEVAIPVSPGGGGDLFFVEARIQHGPTLVQWQLVAPRAASVPLPILPDDFADLQPQVGDAALSAQAWLIDVDNVDGYEAGRAAAFDIVVKAESLAQVRPDRAMRISRSGFR